MVYLFTQQQLYSTFQYSLPYLVSGAVLNSQNLYFHYKTLSKYMLLKYAMMVIHNGLIDQKKRRAF